MGKLAAPCGLEGWVHLHPFADDPLAWAAMPTWWIGQEGGPWRPVAPQGFRQRGEGWVARLEGVADRTAAQALRGFLVAAPREALPPTGENEFYWVDLIGLEVVNAAEESLGRVVGLMATGANTVLRVVDEDKKERLLPFVTPVVVAVDKAAGRIRVAWERDW